MGQATAPVGDGFARHASGLLVPDELKRERQVWTKENWMTLVRANELLTSRGLRLSLGCLDPRCATTEIERLTNLDGSITLRCAHLDRVVVRYPKGRM